MGVFKDATFQEGLFRKYLGEQGIWTHMAPHGQGAGG